MKFHLKVKKDVKEKWRNTEITVSSSHSGFNNYSLTQVWRGVHPLALAKRSSEGVLICLWNTNLPNNLILYFQNFFINSVSDRFVIVVKWQQWERKAECVSMLSLIIATVVDDVYLTIKFLKKLFACGSNNSTRNSSLMVLCYVITTFSFHFFCRLSNIVSRFSFQMATVEKKELSKSNCDLCF